MKKTTYAGSTVRAVALGLAMLASVTGVKAVPYASGITNITLGGSNYVQFIVNEAGGKVGVVFEDSSSNSISTNLPAGKTNFFLGAHTSYQIYCTKVANGTPAQITTDTLAFNQWNAPRGVDINKNPSNGYTFGRIYIGNGANGTTTSGGSRAQGMYALNADCSDSYLGLGTNASYTSTFAGSSVNTSSPYKVSVNPNDNSVDVADYSTSVGTIYKFDPNYKTLTNYVVLGPVGENQGYAAGVHGDPTGVFTTGSVATGDLVVWTADPDLGAPATAQLGVGGNGQTIAGQYNNLFRYDIGSGPLPWTNAPNFAVNILLPTFQDSQTESVSLGADTNKIYVQGYRANLSDGCIQVFDKVSGNIIYDSLHGGADLFAAAYAQCRVSPDGRYLAAITINNVIKVANLTNGIPDESSLISIANTSSTGNARGLAFDAADNVYECSSGQLLLRGYNLGITGTSITGNDVTGTNGTFQLVLPPITATVVATTPLASQNYVNNTVSPGTPIPGVFTITLTTNNNVAPVSVAFTLAGTATLGTQYTINTGTDANGVVLTATTNGTNITFPIGAFPGGGNWSAIVKVIPTTNPVSGPTTTSIIKVIGGANYLAGIPVTATVSIANTGPQFLYLSATASGNNTMTRVVTNDYAKFTLTRWGDTNGPANNSVSITPHTYTVTNFTYLGTAVFPTDYLAQSQRVDPAGNGVAQIPTAGSPGIVINPGDVAITCDVGDPVAHTGYNLKPTNVTVIVNLTNAAGYVTNATSTNYTGVSYEGYAYNVSNTAVTLTELDNVYGPEVVLYNDALTNAMDSTWNLTYSATNLSSVTVLPVLYQNYTNGLNTGGYDFTANFGNPVSGDGIPQSPYMIAQGWTSALKVTTGKGSGLPCAVNLYPQGQNFLGNIALRFSMYLSVYDYAKTAVGGAGREFALFGMDHTGTNANWRPAVTVAAGTGSGPTNCDGQWFAIDASSGSSTPADFDAFLPGPLPNSGTVDAYSSGSSAETGYFKNPPFTNDVATAGGSPVDQWVEVSFEKRQTNSTTFLMSTMVNGSTVIAPFIASNAISPATFTNGTIMLGYESPVAVFSDSTAFVYYSNVRVVELSPFNITPNMSYLALPGTNITFTNMATYAMVPGITNQWYKGTSNAIGAVLQTDTNSSTNITSTYTATNILTGTNFLAIVSDSAGTSTNINIVEIITGPTNVTSAVGVTRLTNFIVVPSGQAAPSAYQWQYGGTNLVNGTKYTNVTTANLFVSNIVSTDATYTYTCVVSNAAATTSIVTPGATLTLSTAPSSAIVTPAAQTNVWGSSATFTVSASGSTPLSYTWKKGSTALYNTSKYSGTNTTTLTISNLTQADIATNYNAVVTNIAGTTTSTFGSLAVYTPQPNISGNVAVSGTSITLTFSSTNTYDKSNSFTLQSSPAANGTYTNATNAVISGTGGSFQVVVPESAQTMFYRLLHN